jgi:hypothetical protein
MPGRALLRTPTLAHRKSLPRDLDARYLPTTTTAASTTTHPAPNFQTHTPAPPTLLTTTRYASIMSTFSTTIPTTHHYHILHPPPSTAYPYHLHTHHHRAPQHSHSITSCRKHVESVSNSVETSETCDFSRHVTDEHVVQGRSCRNHVESCRTMSISSGGDCLGVNMLNRCDLRAGATTWL